MNRMTRSRNGILMTATTIAAATSSLIAADGVSLAGHWDGGGGYADVWGDGDYAYVAHFGSARIDIVDVIDPANPTHVIQYALPPPNTTASAQDVKVGDGLLFISLEGGGSSNSVHIVDVRDPENPVGLVDIFIDGFTAIHNTFYEDGYLYMADSGLPKVVIIDLTDFDPDNPPRTPITDIKWTVNNIGTSFVHDITVVDGRMYASAWNSGVWIYDVTNIASEAPQHLGHGPGDNTHSCWPTANGDYVITGEERSGGGITVYRITENGDGSVSLAVTDTATVPPAEASSVHNQVTIGYRVYNSWYGAGFRVYDVDPATGLLSIVGTFFSEQTGSLWGVYPLLGSDRILLSSIGGGGMDVVKMLVPVPGDVNGDDLVNFTDLVTLLAAWGPCPAPPEACPADFNEDGAVNFTDLLVLLANWT